MVSSLSAVDRLLRDREAEALEYTIGARFIFLFLATALTLSNAESRLDVVFTVTVIATTFVLIAWCLGRVRRRERLRFVGGALVTADAMVLLAFPVMWYLSVGGTEVSSAYLVKNDQALLFGVFMVVNAFTLRPVYPAIIAAVGAIELVGFLLFATLDPRFSFTSSNVEAVLGSGVKLGFYAWPILATILLGVFVSGLAARARRTIRQAVELEISNLRIQEEQGRRLMHARLGAVGSLVAGIAHEINTPLGVITSTVGTVAKCAERLRRAIDDAEGLDGLRDDRHVQGALSTLGESKRMTSVARERIAALVASLEDFARLDRAEEGEADLSVSLDATLALIDPALKGDVRIERRYAGLPPVVCRVNAVNQVFLTVLTNAFEAMGGTGTLRLETYADVGVAGVIVSDTGRGMDREELDRIFEVGLAGKQGRVRLRLGLATARRIIEDHHGTLSVESQVGEGTSFRLELPRRPASQP